ncbi:60S ribosomal subunit assembly or modification protein, partial [Spiromyces aspiralis]
GEFMNVFNGHSGPVTCGRFTHDGRHIVSGSEDGSLIIWDPKSATIVHQFSPKDERFHKGGITCLAISKDDNVIVTGSIDTTAKLFRTNGQFISSLENSDHSVESVGFCDILPLVATGSSDGSINIWDLTTQRLRQQVRHDDAVTKLAWVKDSPMLVSVSADNTVRVWDGRTGGQVQVFKGHQDTILDFSISRLV